MNIGYVGLGDMGGALATRLATQLAAHPVTHGPLHVFDLNTQAVERLVSMGAVASADVATLGASCDAVLLCLPTSAHVRSVIFGSGGLAEHLAPGSIIIDQTSGDPSVTRAMAEEVKAVGLTMVDAPVSGGAPAALAGVISIMLGADDEDADAAITVLRLISETITHIGGVGTGHTMKLVNNLLSCSQRLLSLEALAIATKAGVDPAMAVDVLSKGGGRNAYLEVQAHKVIVDDRDHGFSLALAHKDLFLACGLAAELGVPTFYGSLSRDLYQVAMSDVGRNAHVEVIADFVEKVSGVSLTART